MDQRNNYKKPQNKKINVNNSKKKPDKMSTMLNQKFDKNSMVANIRKFYVILVL